MNIKVADGSGLFAQGELDKKLPIGSAVFHVSGGGGVTSCTYTVNSRKGVFALVTM